MISKNNLCVAVIMISLLAVVSEASGQTFNEWFRQKKTQKQYLIEQIAALQLYLKSLKQGYKVVNKGLNIVGEITGNSYSMDDIYLKSLLDVKQSVSESTLNNSIESIADQIRYRLDVLLERIHSEELITPDEAFYVRRICEKMELLTDEQMEKARQTRKAEVFHMSDADRLGILSDVKTELDAIHSFLAESDAGLTNLIKQRKSEVNDINVLKQLDQ